MVAYSAKPAYFKDGTYGTDIESLGLEELFRLKARLEEAIAGKQLPARNAKVLPLSKVNKILELIDYIKSCDQCEACNEALNQILNILDQAEDTLDVELEESA